jgi:uncharacterized protein
MIPKNRINSIDALRGFALLGIILLHCMEHFDLGFRPQLDSPLWQKIDKIVYDTLYFLFQGKAYAIFSLLFGLSFFMMMDSQAGKGNDFRLRFLWRLVLLFVIGYINGLIYMGEFFIIYAMLGIILIPLYKLPGKALMVLCVLLFMQIPQLIEFASLLSGKTQNAPTDLVRKMSQLFRESSQTFMNGSIWDMLSFNMVKGQTAKMLWFINVYRYLQLAGLFIAGMLIGRSGIHKDPDKMVYWSKKIFFYATGWFLLFYIISWLLPSFGVEKYALRVGTGLFKTYGNLGMMMMYICGFIILYYKTKGGRKTLDRLAPVGRMSVTNYMMQSIMGVLIFYGFGLGLAKQSYLICFLAGVIAFIFQLWYSNWWIKRFYYGPMEWLWRTLTWFRKTPLKRKKDNDTL